MTEPSPVEIKFAPEFRRRVKRLSKRYRSVKSDINSVIEQLKVGKILGNRIPGVDFVVMKVRVRNSDIQKGEKRWISFDILASV